MDDKIIRKYMAKAECENCGEKATKQINMLLPNARTNPASNGYGKDSLKWCSDQTHYSCDRAKCEDSIFQTHAMEWGGTFTQKEGFDVWSEKDITKEYERLSKTANG